MSEAMEKIRRPTVSTGLITTADKMGPRESGPSLKQLTFNWAAKGKYTEPNKFKLEVITIL